MDEVPGKKQAADASALERTYCQPCSQDGETLPAEAYCTVCKEFMCSDCVKFHKKQRITKFHTLLDKRSMPTTMRIQSDVQQSTAPCDVHPEEFIKYFCSSHQTLNCGHCLLLEHRTCEMHIISDISKSYGDGNEFRNINESITKLLNDNKACIADVENKVKFVITLAEDEVSKLREYRDQVNTYFEQRENALLSIIERMLNKDQTRLDSLLPKYDDIRTKLTGIMSKLEAQESNTAHLFIEAKRAQKQLERLQSDLMEINKEMAIHHYRFRRDTCTENLLQSDTGLGTVEEIATDHSILNLKPITEPVSKEQKLYMTVKEKHTHRPDVAEQEQDVQAVTRIDLSGLKITHAPVKSLSDTGNGRMISILFLPGKRMLLADCNDKTVGLLDNFTLPGGPLDMCLLPWDRAAISLTNGSIQFLQTRVQLSLGDNIKVDGDCRGIGYHSARLIVSYFSGKVEIMDMSGKVIKKIDKDGGGRSLFCQPEYLTVVNEGRTAFIYVSDYRRSTITKLDINLNIIQTFQNRAMKGPAGITAVGNHLLICGNDSNNITGIDLTSGQMTQLLGEKEGIRKPRRVCYNQQNNLLYVARSMYSLEDLKYAMNLFKVDLKYK